jgi:hypothetical protein
MQADMKALHKLLVSRHVMYHHNHNKAMRCEQLALPQLFFLAD